MYRVDFIKNNGYRCFCCTNTWQGHLEVEDKQEAYLYAAIHKRDKEGDWEFENVVVSDENGEEIGRGAIEWVGLANNNNRHLKYKMYRWYGCIEGIPFEQLYGNNEGETWAQMVERARLAP